MWHVLQCLVGAADLTNVGLTTRVSDEKRHICEEKRELIRKYDALPKNMSQGSAAKALNIFS